MTFGQLEAKLYHNATAIVGKHAQTFHADIKLAWPVDTGDSRRAWKLSRSGTEWAIENNVSYSGILFVGRVGKRGSNQLAAGGYPILKANILRLKSDLKGNLL